MWFLGKADVQKVKGNPHLQKTNFGYDDERGDYQVVVSDHIAYRYEVQGVLGKGSFGQVLKVLDYKTGTYKALKVIRNKKRFHHQVCALGRSNCGLVCMVRQCCLALLCAVACFGALTACVCQPPRLQNSFVLTAARCFAQLGLTCSALCLSYRHKWS